MTRFKYPLVVRYFRNKHRHGYNLTSTNQTAYELCCIQIIGILSVNNEQPNYLQKFNRTELNLPSSLEALTHDLWNCNGQHNSFAAAFSHNVRHCQIADDRADIMN